MLGPLVEVLSEAMARDGGWRSYAVRCGKRERGGQGGRERRSREQAGVAVAVGVALSGCAACD